MQDGFVLSLRITKKKTQEKRFIIYYVIIVLRKKKKSRTSMYVRRCMCGMYV